MRTTTHVPRHVRNAELDGTQRRTPSCRSVFVTQKHAVNQYTTSCHIPQCPPRPPHQPTVLASASAQERKNTIKRRERDSNPRNGYPFTRFPVAFLRPLGHLSGEGGTLGQLPRHFRPRSSRFTSARVAVASLHHTRVRPRVHAFGTISHAF